MQFLLYALVTRQKTGYTKIQLLTFHVSLLLFSATDGHSASQVISPFLYLPEEAKGKTGVVNPTKELERSDGNDTNKNIADKAAISPAVNAAGQNEKDHLSDDAVKGDVIANENSPEGNKNMKACSVKLVDIKRDGEGSPREAPKREFVDSNEISTAEQPSPKKIRPSDELAGGRALPSNLTITPSKERLQANMGQNAKEKLWSLDPMQASNLKESMGKLLSATNERNVTISPVRAKEGKSNSDKSTVTVTKLSTGTIELYEPKDLKSRLGECNGLAPSSKKKSPNSYSVEMHKKQKKVKLNGKNSPEREGNSNSNQGISCSKCDDDFSTKEAKKLHTCHSILDQRFLTDSGVRSSQNPHVEKSSTYSSPVSSLSQGSSRSSSPLLNQTANNSASTEVKLIKSEKDSLMIEGRPKLTVSKVSHKTTEVKLGGTSSGEKKVVAKLKINPSTSDVGPLSKERSPPSPHSTLNPKNISDPLRLLDEADNNTSNGGSNQRNKPEGLERGEKDEQHQSPTFTGKLKIKLPVPSNTSTSSTSSSNSLEDHQRGYSSSTSTSSATTSSNFPNNQSDKKENDDFAFTFAGKPTYSPSRVEPSAAVPSKGNDEIFCHNNNIIHDLCAFKIEILLAVTFKTILVTFSPVDLQYLDQVCILNLSVVRL